MNKMDLKKIRVLQTPSNPVGQARECTRLLRWLGVQSIVLVRKENIYDGKADICLNLDKTSSVLAKCFILLKSFLKAIFKYNVFHFYCGGSLLPYNIDLPLLKLLGKKMVMNYHGSEIRLKKIAREKNKYFDLIKYDFGSPKSDQKIIREIKRVAKYIDVALVGDYELYSYIYPFFRKVEVIPRVIDLKKNQPVFPSLLNKSSIVIHSPSNKGIKGTDFILSAIRKLQQKYQFQFQLVHNLPHEKAREIYRNSDIIIDQLLLGVSGVVSLEAMALGKPVICYLRKDLQKFYPEFPVFNATVENIEEKIAVLLENSSLREELGRKGRKYVEKYHNEQMIAEKLIKVYQDL